jgi:hypothetical protein
MTKLSANNFVIGIDPGPDQSAYVEFDGSRVWRRGIVTNKELQDMISFLGQSPIFIEMIASYGMAVGASVFNTCVAIGWLECEANARGLKAHRVFRKDIKLHLCQSPRAKDANVRQALIDRLGPQGTKKAPGPTYGVKSHEWAALAVAVYGWDMTFGRASGLSKTNSNPQGAPDS